MTTHSKMLLLVFVALGASLGVVIAQAQKKPAIAYPSYPNDPRHWRHVKSMVIFSKENKLFARFGGLHNVYVNDIGWPSLQKNRIFPDGSMLALELFDIATYQGAIEGRQGRKAMFLMKKNAKLYPETGGWGFELFQGNTEQPTLTSMKECWDCHKVGKSRDYVISEYVE